MRSKILINNFTENEYYKINVTVRNENIFLTSKGKQKKKILPLKVRKFHMEIMK